MKTMNVNCSTILVILMYMNMKMLTEPLSTTRTTPDLDLDDSTNTEVSLLVASGLLILLLLCALLICYKKMWALFIIFINISESSTFLLFDWLAWMPSNSFLGKSKANLFRDVLDKKSCMMISGFPELLIMAGSMIFQ